MQQKSGLKFDENSNITVSSSAKVDIDNLLQEMIKNREDRKKQKSKPDEVSAEELASIADILEKMLLVESDFQSACENEIEEICEKDVVLAKRDFEMAVVDNEACSDLYEIISIDEGDESSKREEFFKFITQLGDINVNNYDFNTITQDEMEEIYAKLDELYNIECCEQVCTIASVDTEELNRLLNEFLSKYNI